MLSLELGFSVVSKFELLAISEMALSSLLTLCLDLEDWLEISLLYLGPLSAEIIFLNLFASYD